MDTKKKLVQDFLENNLDKDGQKAFFRALDNKEILGELDKSFEEDLQSDKSFADAYAPAIDSEATYANIKSEIVAHQKRAYRFTILKIAAAILLPLLVVNASVWFYLNQKPETTWSEIYVPKGEKAQFVFQDGTKVWLNSDTKLTYPTNFGSNLRKVKLDGEGYFVVHKNVVQPFLVEMNKLTVKVTGTSFNVIGYSASSKIVATLDEGKIALLIDKKPEQKLLPGDEATVDCLTGEVKMVKVAISDSPMSKSDKLVFDNIMLDEVVQIIERKYNINITLKDSKVKTYKYHLKFDKASVDEVFEALQLITPIEVTKEGDGYVIGEKR